MKSILAAIAYFGLIYAASSWLNVEGHAEAEEMERNGGWVLKVPAPFHRARYGIKACPADQGGSSGLVTVALDRECWSPIAN